MKNDVQAVIVFILIHKTATISLLKNYLSTILEQLFFLFQIYKENLKSTEDNNTVEINEIYRKE